MAKDLIFVADEVFQNNKKVINIIGKGSSGTIIGTIICQELIKKYPNCSIHYLHLKKEGEVSHSNKIDSILFEKAINIWVDDFMFSGRTMEYSIHQCRELTHNMIFKWDYVIIGGFINKFETKKFIDVQATHNLIGYCCSKDIFPIRIYLDSLNQDMHFIDCSQIEEPISTLTPEQEEQGDQKSS